MEPRKCKVSLLQCISGRPSARENLERTYHIPQASYANIAPGAVDLTFLIQAPDGLTFLKHGITTDALDVCTAVAQPIVAINRVKLQRTTCAPGSKDNYVCLKLTPVIKLYRMFCKLLDLWPAFQLYLSIHDKLRSPRLCVRHFQNRCCLPKDSGMHRNNNPHPCSIPTAQGQYHVCRSSAGTRENASRPGDPFK
jgi:hypothetical protein